MKKYTNADGFYNKTGTKVIPGPATVYSGTWHTGYLKFVTSGGSMTLDGDKKKRIIEFTAGSAPTVTPNKETKTFLVQNSSTATQNFSSNGLEDAYD